MDIDPGSENGTVSDTVSVTDTGSQTDTDIDTICSYGTGPW